MEKIKECAIYLVMALCLFMSCAGDTVKENADLRQKIEEFKESITTLRKENAKLRNRVAGLEQELEKAAPKEGSRKPKKPEEPEQRTKKVASWKGSGQKTTEPFRITKTPWAVIWSSNPGQYGGFLSISVHKTNGELVSLAANTTEKTSDVSYVYETGTFYLGINAANTKWVIEVHKSL